MNISVIGSGYAGLVTGACFTEFGMKMICADVDRGKLRSLRNCSLPIYDPERVRSSGFANHGGGRK